MHCLEVEQLDVFYGQIPALRGLSLHVGRGEMVALLGVNGAGKTTTLRTISGLLAPRRGSVVVAGRDITGLPAHEVVRLGVSHLPEGRELFPSLTVVENLRMGYWPKRTDKAGLQPAMDRVMDAFARLRERASQPAGTLSGGEQQMLAVARALMSSPTLLLVVAQLFDSLRQVNAQGTAVLLVEQFVHMALQNSDRAYVLAKGEVVASGPSAELLRDRRLVETYLGGTAPAPVP